MDKKVISYGGESITPAGGGDLIREGMGKAAKRVFDEASTTYKSVFEGRPNMTVTPESWTDLSKSLDDIKKTSEEAINLYSNPDLIRWLQ